MKYQATVIYQGEVPDLLAAFFDEMEEEGVDLVRLISEVSIEAQNDQEAVEIFKKMIAEIGKEKQISSMELTRNGVMIPLGNN